MKHSHIDEYSYRDSFIHRLDPRTKLIATLLFILVVISTPVVQWQTFTLYVLLIALLIFLAKLPFPYVFKRSLVIIPFVLLIAVSIPFLKPGEVVGSYNLWRWQVSVTYDGLYVFLNVLVKAWLSILSLIVLTSTTKLADLLKGLEHLRVPRVMIMILSFMYRYIFVLEDEVMRMRQARDARNFGGSRLWHIRTLGNMIGTLFIRSYERGERIYAAMLSRGYNGQSETLHRLSFKPADAYFGASFTSVLVLAGMFTLLH